MKKNIKTALIISVICFLCAISITFLLLKSLDSSSVILRINNGASISSVYINNQVVYSGEPIGDGSSRYFFEINKVKYNNTIRVFVINKTTGSASQRSCKFNKIDRWCYAEVYVTKGGISCYDCVSD